MFTGWRSALAENEILAREGQTRLSTTCGSERLKRTCEGVADDPEAVNPQCEPGPKLRCLVGQTFVFLGAGNERFRNGRNRGMLDGHDRPLKRNLQHFIHGLYKFYCETGEDFLRYLR